MQKSAEMCLKEQSVSRLCYFCLGEHLHQSFFFLMILVYQWLIFFYYIFIYKYIPMHILLEHVSASTLHDGFLNTLYCAAVSVHALI